MKDGVLQMPKPKSEWTSAERNADRRNRRKKAKAYKAAAKAAAARENIATNEEME